MKPESHELRAWMNRWEAVKQQEIEELRHAAPALRYRQLIALMRMSQHLGWFDKMRSEDDAGAEAEVRGRWLKLKKSYRAQKEA